MISETSGASWARPPRFFGESENFVASFVASFVGFPAVSLSTKLATKLTTKAPLRGVLRDKWGLWAQRPDFSGMRERESLPVNDDRRLTAEGRFGVRWQPTRANGAIKGDTAFEGRG